MGNAGQTMTIFAFNILKSNAPGCGALVGVLHLVILVSSGIAEFELCVSQKYCVMTRIALTCSGVFYAINSGFK